MNTVLAASCKIRKIIITPADFGNHMDIKLRQNKLLCIKTDPANHLFGDRVTLSVIAVELNNISYRWLKNDVLLSTAKDPAYDGLHTPKLAIFPFTREYEGSYKCIISCEDGEVVESTVVELTLGK